MWAFLIVTVLATFLLLGFFGGEVYRQAPPKPEVVVEADGGTLFTKFLVNSWRCGTNRPGTNITYTNNWPHEPLIGHVVGLMLRCLSPVLTATVHDTESDSRKQVSFRLSRSASLSRCFMKLGFFMGPILG